MSNAGLRAWCYHCPVPPDQTKIEYPDVRLDQGAFDYDALVEHWKRAAWRSGADDVTVQGYWPGCDTTAPMYSRVIAMNEYVDHALLFDMPIAFLDSDAFLNQDIRHIFAGDWDIGVTYRHNMGMHLNEGVIFANNKRPDAVRSFFQAYLDTYHRILETPEHVAKYGNLKRWRGGQLSLNTLACPQGLPNALDYQEIAGARVAYFPCFRWNFSCERIVPEELDTKAIIHLKGARKHLLDDLIKYQTEKK
jgi:hypothetical protein